VKITLYFDEDAQDSDLIQALDLRGVSVIGAWSAGMRERKDEEHLLWAAAQNRSLYSFNVRDYCRLHAEFLVQGRSHAGIILAKQQQYSVGEQMRRLLKMIATKPVDEMTNKIEFLSDWE
jgi:nitrogenase subunit NifH